MKLAAQVAGLDVPRYQAVENPWDLIDFGRRHGPVVVKPRQGAGAAGVVVLHTAEEIEHYIATVDRDWDQPAELMVEELIDGPMLTVDGLTDGESLLIATVNRYIGSCLGAVTNNDTVIYHQLDDASPIARTALSYAERVVHALPSPNSVIAIHCEIFLHDERGPLLCEIAGRTGGSAARDIFLHRTGVDLERAMCLAQAGEPLQLNEGAHRTSRFAGLIHLTCRAGTVAAAEVSCPMPDVIGFTTYVRVGDRTAAARKFSDAAAVLMIGGNSEADLNAACLAASNWMSENFRWDSIAVE